MTFFARCRFASLVVLAPLALAAPAAAQRAAAVGPPAAVASEEPPAIPREFRAAWIATVGNMDWPSRSGLSTAEQKAELVTILNRAASLGLNAVIFQVRPAGDALYASRLEPWSQFLTGEQGRAPAPFYDPLAFVIEEAHRRGIEVHAWFNPFRAHFARHVARASRSHVVNTHPGWVKRYGDYLWMDPGRADVRQRALDVVADVVRRYDVDGIHVDDYFYPYQEHDRNGRLIPFPDDDSYAAYQRNGGRLGRADWRRLNVDTFVEALYGTVKRLKPEVKVGISPFGIWRPGHPASVRGLDAYSEIFADSRKWVQRGWLDYVAPQLYWRADSPQQRYDELLRWWVEQNEQGRHIWVGNFTSRVQLPGAMWPAEEIVRQVRMTRADPGASGNIHFSMTALLRSPDGLASRLAELYERPALVPASPWLGRTGPAQPNVTIDVEPRSYERVVNFTAAQPGVRLWAIRARTGGQWQTEIVPAWVRSHRLSPEADVIYVNAVDRLGNESRPAVIRLDGGVTSAGTARPR